MNVIFGLGHFTKTFMFVILQIPLKKLITIIKFADKT